MDLKQLNLMIEEKAISKSAIAHKLNISRNALYAKLEGRIKMSIEDCCELAVILGMTHTEVLNIFFPQYVRKYAM